MGQILKNQVSKKKRIYTYRNAISIFLANTLSFGLALLEGVLVLELGPHDDR